MKYFLNYHNIDNMIQIPMGVFDSLDLAVKSLDVENTRDILGFDNVTYYFDIYEVCENKLSEFKLIKTCVMEDIMQDNGYFEYEKTFEDV